MGILLGGERQRTRRAAATEDHDAGCAQPREPARERQAFDVLGVVHRARGVFVSRR
jgi:hypothetical protein